MPDLLVAPNWEVGKIARFSEAVKALFEDLTPYLQGDKVERRTRCWPRFPTGAWEHSVWGGKLAAVPFPDRRAVLVGDVLPQGPASTRPASSRRRRSRSSHELGKALTDPSKGVWAFGSIFSMVQQFYGVAGSTETGWRKKADGSGLEHKYETPEYREALEFTTKLYADGLVHPDIMASQGRRREAAVQGRQDPDVSRTAWAPGGACRPSSRKVLARFNMQPVPVFAAVAGRDPHLWGTEKPIFWTFVKKGLGKEKVEELLRGAQLRWPRRSAPRSGELREYGVEGKHFTRAADGSPAKTDLGRKEIGSQFQLPGRPGAHRGQQRGHPELRPGPAEVLQRHRSSTTRRT